jgi:hypothetical protein
MRAFCLKYGIAIYQGVDELKAEIPRVLAHETIELTPRYSRHQVGGRLETRECTRPLYRKGRAQRLRIKVLGRVDKRVSQTPHVLIQDCFLRSGHGSRGPVGWGVGTDRAAAAA